MKATKNQANAVRSYLASLGMNISHVQALEVIARGAGQRSRHVKAPATGGALFANVEEIARLIAMDSPFPGGISKEFALKQARVLLGQDEAPAQDVFAEVLKLRAEYVEAEQEGTANEAETVQQIQELFPDLFDTREAIEAFLAEVETVSVSTNTEEVSRAGALRNAYVQAGRTPEAQATVLKALVWDCSDLFASYEEAHAFLRQFDEESEKLKRFGFVVPQTRQGVVTAVSAEEVLQTCQVCDTALDEEGYCQKNQCIYNDWPQSISASGIFELPDAEIERLTGVKKRSGFEARAAAPVHVCQVCDSALDGQGYCSDDTCVYSDWPQLVDIGLAFNLPVDEIERRTGIKKRVRSEVDSVEELSDRIKQEYMDSGCQRADLQAAVSRLTTECSELFENEAAGMAFLMDSAGGDGAYAEMVRAVAIKAEYNESRCEAGDVDHAVARLLAECPSLYQDSRKAWSYINEEPHEELEGLDFIIQVEADVFGLEVFTYDTEEERRAGIVRLMAKAVELNDGVDRQYYFSEINSDIEKNTEEYYQELRMRELEGSIVGGLVIFGGKELGTIADITADGLTLYSWVDETP